MSASDVTDHALVRYLERVYGVDVKAVKCRISAITQEGREQGASAVNSDGVRYALGQNGRVVGIRGANDRMSKRAKRWKRRHK